MLDLLVFMLMFLSPKCPMLVSYAQVKTSLYNYSSRRATWPIRITIMSGFCSEGKWLMIPPPSPSLLPLHLDGCQYIADLSPAWISLVLIYTPRWREADIESEVPCQRTRHKVTRKPITRTARSGIKRTSNHPVPPLLPVVAVIVNCKFKTKLQTS